MIYVGIIHGQGVSDSAPLARAIQRLAAGLASTKAMRGGVDLVFVASGRLAEPGFDGMRLGRLSRSQEIVQVRVALPETVYAMPDPLPILTKHVAEAVRVAAGKLQAQGISFDETAHLKALEEATGLRVQPKAVSARIAEVGDPPTEVEVSVSIGDPPQRQTVEALQEIESEMEMLLGPIGGRVATHEWGGGTWTWTLEGPPGPVRSAAVELLRSRGLRARVRNTGS